MEIFDKLGDTIVSVSKDATQKAKDISELARIRMEIRSKQDYLNKLFQETGKLYYEAHKDDEALEFEDQIVLIKDAKDVLDDLKQQLSQLKGTIKCMNCGQEMPLEADYCSKCGTKLNKKEEVRPEEDDKSSTVSAETEKSDTGSTQKQETEEIIIEEKAETEEVVLTEDAQETGADNTLNE